MKSTEALTLELFEYQLRIMDGGFTLKYQQPQNFNQPFYYQNLPYNYYPPVQYSIEQEYCTGGSNTNKRITLKENAGPASFLTPENSVLLLIDHQVGLMQIIDDMPPEQVKNNVLGLAKTAKTLGIPVLLTTSRDWGPNGQILPEIKALFPNLEIIRRPGVINAYRWPPFRQAIEKIGRKKIIIAGVTDSTCLQFPSLDMVLDGYDVHAVIDASGAESPGQIVREATIATLTQAGVKIKTWFGVAAELIADWRRDEARGWPLATGPVHEHLPSWGYLLDTSMDYATGKMTAPSWFVEGKSEPTTQIPSIGHRLSINN
ncbi:isochorismatase family protein [Bacillus sp. AR2-1]|uniref:isochorismatase family protein n=1 Tax=Bacillus sp. AR2-1 TaxID=2217816 RepID=UPI001C552714|nr:isochorismatase family protein [Bacillus sp. AR2-1]